MKASIIHI